MDFSAVELDEDTRLFWADVRSFLDERIEAVHEHEWQTGDGINVDLHLSLGAKGWLMPTLPPEEGGIGATALQAAIINRELIRYRVPLNTHSNTMQVIAALQEYGTKDVLSEVLPGVPRGEIRFCLGYTEPDAGSDLANVTTRAIRDGDEWTISGQKMFTTSAQNAQYAFVLARTDPDVPKRKGLTMFLVPLASDAVEIHAIHTLGGERSNMVFFDEVRVPDKYRVGPVNEGWAVLSNPLKTEHGMGESVAPDLESEGGLNFTRTLACTLDAAVEWARTDRMAPGGAGQPIHDPLVRQRLAQVALDIELGKLTSGPVGRVASSDLLIRDAADLVDLVGPEGLLRRGEPHAVADGWIEYAHRFAQGTATYGGTTDIHRGIIAEQFLGLPRSRPS